ncbi:rab-like protein 3 isoform X1 [Argopecten irradians]|uniref:rab-like protein 3 isoform X1 n=1 Tax=Argopecten irradians TaxID=31199 RepID=UPI00370FBAC2
MAAVDKIKIVVVGDSGVGKTSLVHLICHNETTSNPGWTIGCSVEVKLHEYKAGTPSQKTYFAELWDVGGSTSHENSRAIFYNPVHGIILVHDLTNRKSHHNLRKWLQEVLNRDNPKESNGYEYDPEQFAGNQIPILVVGTKADVAQSLRENVLTRASSMAEECGAEELNLSCHNVKHLSPGSSNAVKISRFFDKVIERRYYSRDGVGQGHVTTPTMDRRRPMKSFHND